MTDFSFGFRDLCNYIVDKPMRLPTAAQASIMTDEQEPKKVLKNLYAQRTRELNDCKFEILFGIERGQKSTFCDNLMHDQHNQAQLRALGYTVQPQTQPAPFAQNRLRVSWDVPKSE